MKYRAAVAGASGYAGGELIRLLSQHPNIELATLTAASTAGSTLAQVHPHLRSLGDWVIEPTTPQILNEHDVVFMALPHGKTGQVAADLSAALVVDCSADFRLRSADAWQKYYGGTHWGSWEYGIPELLLSRADWSKQRQNLAGAKRIAAPGCNASAVTLAVAPGLKAALLSPEITVTAVVGPSGAGKALRPDLQASELLGSAHPYAVGGKHRHIPEILQNLAPLSEGEVRLTFTPVLAPFSRGILVVASARAKGSPAEIRQAWEAAYAQEAFVHLLPEGVMPRVADVVGSNNALIGLAVEQASGGDNSADSQGSAQVTVVCAIDNLVKGTAGAAIQSANLALGLPEQTALPLNALAP